MAGIRQEALMHRRLAQLIDQHLGQPDIGIAARDIDIAAGKVAEDGLQNIADGQGDRSARQMLAVHGIQIHRTVNNRLGVVGTVLGVGRHPDGVLRWRHKALAIDFKAHHSVGHIVQRAPGMGVGHGMAVGFDLGIAKVNRRRQAVELGDVDQILAHAVWIRGEVGWIAV